MNNFWQASIALSAREIVRFVRQRQRIIGALGTPLVFWVLIGSGLSNSFRSSSLMSSSGEGLNYLQYFYPGTIALIIMFSAIFSTISIIEDRQAGFLQSVLVAPVPRSSIVLGKILGGTVLAAAQGFLFMLFTPFLKIFLDLPSVVYLVSLVFFLSFGLTGVGFCIAWKLDSTQGFHAIMNLFLMPMWLLSGALFPTAGAPKWLSVVMMANPLTYGVAGLQRGFFEVVPETIIEMPSRLVCLAVSALFAAVLFYLSMAVIRRSEGRG